MVDDKNKFVRFIILKYFKGYNILNTDRLEVGHPDFILEKNKNKIYLELKIGLDSLRISQLEWFIKNKAKNNKLIWISWEDDFSNNINADSNL